MKTITPTIYKYQQIHTQPVADNSRKAKIIAFLVVSLLFISSSFVFAQTTAPCVQTDQCFEFSYLGATPLQGNKVKIQFQVKVNCSHDLSNVAFQLPAGATATAFTPTTGVENPTNNPFYSIKWNTGSGFKNGAVASFSYTVSASAFNTMTTIQAHAKASTTVGQVTFNLANCNPTTPPCAAPHVTVQGPSTVCAGTAMYYTANLTSGNSASYTWVVPNGWVVNSGQGSSVLKVTPNTASGNVGVTATNTCGTDSDDMGVVAQTCGSGNNGGGNNGGGNNGGGNNGGGNGGDPCPTSQPRPITGNQTPCPGTIETYCIDNDRGYLSFEWDVPRAQAGNPPTGWEIISGQGTNCVTVRVGEKPGTMKVKVEDPICGTKVATLPVHPGDAFNVGITGPDTVCFDEEQIFTATISGGNNGNGNGNGNGNHQGTFTYTWTVPADWTIVDGQGTAQLTVIPGFTEGEVTVTANYTPSSTGNGNGNNGNGVGGHNKTYCNTSDTAEKDVYIGEDCGSINPLPVEMISFNAARAQTTVLLDWATASEKNNMAFEVERSRDGRTFETVGKVAGNGTTEQVSKYTYTDTRPFAELSYYRLKQIDRDGKFEYSAVRSVGKAGGAVSEPVRAYPNPTNGVVKVELPMELPESTQITITSATGQTVYTGTAGAVMGANQQIDLSRFTAGVYILNINSEQTKQSLRITKL